MNACIHAASNTWSLTQSESTKSTITSGKLIRLAFDLDLFAVVEIHCQLSQNIKESFLVKSWWLPSADYSHGSDADLCYEGYGVVVVMGACHCNWRWKVMGLALCEWLSLRVMAALIVVLSSKCSCADLSAISPGYMSSFSMISRVTLFCIGGDG